MNYTLEQIKAALDKHYEDFRCDQVFDSVDDDNMPLRDLLPKSDFDLFVDDVLADLQDSPTPAPSLVEAARNIIDNTTVGETKDFTYPRWAWEQLKAALAGQQGDVDEARQMKLAARDYAEALFGKYDDLDSSLAESYIAAESAFMAGFKAALRGGE